MLSTRTIGDCMLVRNKLFVWLVVVSILVAVPSWAQAQGGTLNGCITNANGGQVPNATVALVPPAPIMANMTMAPPPPIPGRVNADGTFTFTGIAPGPYVFAVDAPGYERSSPPVTLPTN